MAVKVQHPKVQKQSSRDIVVIEVSVSAQLHEVRREHVRGVWGSAASRGLNQNSTLSHILQNNPRRLSCGLRCEESQLVLIVGSENGRANLKNREINIGMCVVKAHNGSSTESPVIGSPLPCWVLDTFVRRPHPKSSSHSVPRDALVLCKKPSL